MIRTDDDDGYTQVYVRESTGRNFFGLKILVKMSERQPCELDNAHLDEAADALKRGFQTVSAQLDPDGPATIAFSRQQIENIYKAAGESAIYSEQLPNGYCDQPCCLNQPWWRVTSRIGHVVIGWRKRVMEIDWTATQVAKTGKELFPDEDVTRDFRGIHAWSVEKAAEYIRRLHAEATAVLGRQP